MSICYDCYWKGKPYPPCPNCGPSYSKYTMDRSNRVGIVPYTEADFIKTKADCIRSMNDLDLAKLVFSLGNGREYCYGHCIYQDDEAACEAAQRAKDGCVAGVLAWLKSPAEEHLEE